MSLPLHHWYILIIFSFKKIVCNPRLPVNQLRSYPPALVKRILLTVSIRCISVLLHIEINVQQLVIKDLSNLSITTCSWCGSSFTREETVTTSLQHQSLAALLVDIVHCSGQFYSQDFQNIHLLRTEWTVVIAALVSSDEDLCRSDWNAAPTDRV